MSFFSKTLADLKSTTLSKKSIFIKIITTQGTILPVIIYRISNSFYNNKITKPFSFIFHRLNVFMYSIDIHPSAIIGKGLIIAHGIGIVIGGGVIIGDNCKIYQGVTIGARGKILKGRQMPQIGDNCSLYSGAQILGPVTIGDNSQVGAGAIVLKDCPNNSVLVGNPAKNININE